MSVNYYTTNMQFVKFHTKTKISPKPTIRTQNFRNVYLQNPQSGIKWYQVGQSGNH